MFTSVRSITIVNVTYCYFYICNNIMFYKCIFTFVAKFSTFTYLYHCILCYTFYPTAIISLSFACTMPLPKQDKNNAISTGNTNCHFLLKPLLTYGFPPLSHPIGAVVEKTVDIYFALEGCIKKIKNNFAHTIIGNKARYQKTKKGHKNEKKDHYDSWYSSDSRSFSYFVLFNVAKHMSCIQRLANLPLQKITFRTTI